MSFTICRDLYPKERSWGSWNNPSHNYSTKPSHQIKSKKGNKGSLVLCWVLDSKNWLYFFHIILGALCCHIQAVTFLLFVHLYSAILNCGICEDDIIIFVPTSHHLYMHILFLSHGVQRFAWKKKRHDIRFILYTS